jgi:anti-sigma factor RsiW
MPHAQELTCVELVELVTDYLEGALDPAVHARFEDHLADCEHCVDYLGQIERTILAAGRLSEQALEPAARDALLAAFRGWRDATAR